MDNYEALGYMLLACKKANLSHKETKELYLNMNYMFDMKTENEAYEQGFKWYRSLDDEE